MNDVLLLGLLVAIVVAVVAATQIVLELGR